MPDPTPLPSPMPSHEFHTVQNEAQNALHRSFSRRIAVEMDVNLRPVVSITGLLEQVLTGDQEPEVVREMLQMAKGDAERIKDILYRYWAEARMLSGLSEQGDAGAARLAIPIQQLPGAEDLPLPSYKTDGAAGMDLYAAVSEPLVLVPGQRAAVPTGIAFAVPPGYEAQVRARSGLARHHGIALVNAPGTIDSDYRGEVAVLLVNLGDEPFTINRGERIAQLVIAPVVQAAWEVSETLEETSRGAGGFGHTGRHP